MSEGVPAEHRLRGASFMWGRLQPALDRLRAASTPQRPAYERPKSPDPLEPQEPNELPVDPLFDPYVLPVDPGLLLDPE